MGSFYSRLSYSFGNEDWQTETKALKIKPSDRVLCVTASGDRPLNLLTNDLKEIVAIDANPLQNALFDLKKIAMLHLSYPDYLAFMGVDPHQNRLKAFKELEAFLDISSVAIWKEHYKKIHRGILYEGAVEKCLKVASKVLNGFRSQKIKKLFAFEKIEAQREFLEKEWPNFFLKKGFEVLLHPKVSRFFINDPGLYAHIDPNIHPGKYLYSRLHSSLNHTLAKDSILFSLIFKGSVEKTSFPPYLNEQGVNLIRKRLGRARFQTADLISFLESCEDNYFDCYSISDVASYLDPHHFTRLMENIHRTAKNGARFCLRQFLSNHQIPTSLEKAFQRNSTLEKQLEKEDRCFVYQFMVGTIDK